MKNLPFICLFMFYGSLVCVCVSVRVFMSMGFTAEINLCYDVLYANLFFCCEKSKYYSCS